MGEVCPVDKKQQVKTPKSSMPCKTKKRKFPKQKKDRPQMTKIQDSV